MRVAHGHPERGERRPGQPGRRHPARVVPGAALGAGAGQAAPGLRPAFVLIGRLRRSVEGGARGGPGLRLELPVLGVALEAEGAGLGLPASKAQRLVADEHRAGDDQPDRHEHARPRPGRAPSPGEHDQQREQQRPDGEVRGLEQVDRHDDEGPRHRPRAAAREVRARQPERQQAHVRHQSAEDRGLEQDVVLPAGDGAREREREDREAHQPPQRDHADAGGEEPGEAGGQVLRDGRSEQVRAEGLEEEPPEHRAVAVPQEGDRLVEVVAGVDGDLRIARPVLPHAQREEGEEEGPGARPEPWPEAGGAAGQGGGDGVCGSHERAPS